MRRKLVFTLGLCLAKQTDHKRATRLVCCVAGQPMCDTCSRTHFPLKSANSSFLAKSVWEGTCGLLQKAFAKCQASDQLPANLSPQLARLCFSCKPSLRPKVNLFFFALGLIPVVCISVLIENQGLKEQGPASDTPLTALAAGGA